MAELFTSWQSPDAIHNTQALRAGYPGVFSAFAELDALGHRSITRISRTKRSGVGDLVGVAMLRRIVTLFSGIRHLFEASSIEPAKVVIRAQFETLLAIRYLVHGGRRDISPNLPSNRSKRESRARYYMAAAIRQEIYRRQALLDRANKTGKIDASARMGLQAEIDERVNQLNRYYRTQMQAFGPLACYASQGKRRYYDHQKWYSFGFRKPVNTVKQFAGRLGWSKLYTFTYDPFSSLTHPTGLTHDLSIEDGQVDIFSPHMAEAFELLAFWTCHWQSIALVYITKAYEPQSIKDSQEVNLRLNELLEGLQAELPAGWF